MELTDALPKNEDLLRPKNRSSFGPFVSVVRKRRPCKTIEIIITSTHWAATTLSNIVGLYTSRVFSRYYTARTTGPSFLLCFAMRANLVMKFLRVSSGKRTSHIILEQQAEFERQLPLIYS